MKSVLLAFKLVALLVEVLFFLCCALIIGFWWVPGLSRGDFLSSFLMATLALFIGGVFYRYVWRRRDHRTFLLILLYTVFSVIALCGYFYGIFLHISD